jgi:hypothetical protein
MKSKTMSDKIRNYYSLIPDHMKKKSHNPNYKNHFFNIPFRVLICGGSGSGKTNSLLELIHRMNNTFEKIVICCKNKTEPLYDYLEEKIESEYLQFYEGINNIPPIEDFEGCGQTLIVFDDLVMDKNQSIIEQYFIRGRKIGEGISLCYLSQSFFRTPKSIRLNVNYVMLMGMASRRDLNLLLSEFVLGKDVDLKRLLELYNYSTKNKMDFFLVDIDHEDKRLRHGFLEIL